MLGTAPRQSLLMSQGWLAIFMTRPITAGSTALALAWFIRAYGRRSRAARARAWPMARNETQVVAAMKAFATTYR